LKCREAPSDFVELGVLDDLQIFLVNVDWAHNDEASDQSHQPDLRVTKDVAIDSLEVLGHLSEQAGNVENDWKPHDGEE